MNFVDLVLIVALAIIIGRAIQKVIIYKRKGGCSCGGNCSCCSGNCSACGQSACSMHKENQTSGE